MASQLDICNSALVKLGGMPKVSTSDGSKEGILLEARFSFAKDYVLREHPWKCAIKRVALAPLPATPLSIPNNLKQWQYQYQLPADYVRMTLNDDDRLFFQIEGTTFLSNINNAVIKYVYSVTDIVQLDSHLAETIAWYLAQDIAMALVQNSQVCDRMMKGYSNWLSRAKFIDASTSRAITQTEYFYEEVRMQANHI